MLKGTGEPRRGHTLPTFLLIALQESLPLHSTAKLVTRLSAPKKQPGGHLRATVNCPYGNFSEGKSLSHPSSSLSLEVNLQNPVLSATTLL